MQTDIGTQKSMCSAIKYKPFFRNEIGLHLYLAVLCIFVACSL